MVSKPYVGVTGLTTREEVESTIREFEQAGYTLNSGHLPMIGFLVSQKTLHGEPTSNRRYPKIEDLKFANSSRRKSIHDIAL